VLFLDHGTRRGEGLASLPGCFLPPGKNRYPLYRRLGGPQGPVWAGAENLAPPTGIRSPDRPARSQSLNRLRYPTHYFSTLSERESFISSVAVRRNGN